MMRKCVIAAAVLAIASAAAPSTSPSPALRLRGGGVLSSLGERLGWKRDKIGPSELGCGPLPQVILILPMRAGTAAGLSQAARCRLPLPAALSACSGRRSTRFVSSLNVGASVASLLSACAT
jgi:hypothetical protein